jgi:tRNA A37 N6-isopentenylltransferase MiaA
MKSEILKESLRYAKRQMTWFKRDKEIVWIDPSTSSGQVNKLVSEFIK